VLYLALASYQLGLPGLHYDEAREAGVNAMEILTGAPITAFRGAGLVVGGRTFPLDGAGLHRRAQRLPGAALPGADRDRRAQPADAAHSRRAARAAACRAQRLRVDRLAAHAGAACCSQRRSVAPISRSGLLAVSLLAASPSFVFWSRQGIFVTNLTQVFVFLCIWQAVRWLRTGRSHALVVAALAAGLALYAKLLAIWVIVPLALLAAGAWLAMRRRNCAPSLGPRTLIGAAAAFLLPLLPLLIFNVQSGGTFASIGGNLGQSYYGVNNLAIGDNLGTRLEQLVQVLRGDHFWYLGAVFTNQLAPWLAIIVVVVGAARAPVNGVAAAAPARRRCADKHLHCQRPLRHPLRAACSRWRWQSSALRWGRCCRSQPVD
jgi:hypothetical protein